MHLSSLSNNTALRPIRQHAQPVSTDSTTTHSSDFVPQYFTSGIDTASLLSSDVETARLYEKHFSEELNPTPVAPHVRLPDYLKSQHYKPPTPNFADYPIRVDGTTIFEPQSVPRFTIHTERFNNNNDTLSTKRKETELKWFPSPNIELKIEVKVKFNDLNPYQVFLVAKLQHKTTSVPFIVIYTEFHSDPDLLEIAYSEIVFCNPYSRHKYTTSFYHNITPPWKNILPYSLNSTHGIAIELTDTDSYLRFEGPNITIPMFSHYDCAKQPNFRRFTFLTVKQCTEDPSNIQHANINARVYVRAKAKRVKALKCEA